MPSIEKIQTLLVNLPERDIELSQKLLKDREFTSLMEIIDSDIYLVRKNLNKETPNKEFMVSAEALLELKNALTDYMSYLILDDDDLEYLCDDYD